MSLHPLAGKRPPADMLIDIDQLRNAYYDNTPDPTNPEQQLSFGTSGHRGSSLVGSFNEAHVVAVTRALVEYRKAQGITGPILIGFDTHGLAWPAFITTVEVLAGAQTHFYYQKGDTPTPTPVISRAIIAANREQPDKLSDGIILTPSHNPPEDGGFKYNPPHGGPADTDTTAWIEQRANEILPNWQDVPRVEFSTARAGEYGHETDFIMPYVRALDSVVDMQAIAKAGVSIGVDPMGGAALPYWQPIAQYYGLDLELVNAEQNPDFHFIPVDHDGKIRMDCSSPSAMSRLLELRDHYDVAFGNDADADRHGVVTAEGGLLNPNHYLSVAIDYLFTHRKQWSNQLQIGKTIVSSSMIDRVAAGIKRQVFETPVGIKWFQPGLTDGILGFGGEESAGATFLARDGSVWTTDKDGIIMGLLAAEILAVTGKDPWMLFGDLTQRYGQPHYGRKDAPISAAEKARFKAFDPQTLSQTALAGEPITAVRNTAPGNNAPLGGLKIETDNGWFAARPSGTEAIYKIYAESFVSTEHLKTIFTEAQKIVTDIIQS
ncbi:MAG TPA: alpha-D-glucose phosphate-specific phosphoglucomutase [Halothiobacillaceae bacterium]|nr:alpha-D-glucose phosphate-specific phosphoglucomutase [Halothiobacillaceae bacterium]